MRPSYEALPSWLSHLPKVAPTPIRAYVPPEEGVVQRALRNSRLPLHVAAIAILAGVGAAAAIGTVRSARAERSEEMNAFATRKVAELQAAGTLHARSPLTTGGSLVADVPGFFDTVDGTDGKRFRRRWDVDGAPTGSRRIVVRLIPMSPAAGTDTIDVMGLVPRR